MSASREFLRLCAVILVLLHVSGGLAYAREPKESDSARAERAQGTVAVNLGRYDDAVDHFSKAYTLTQDPVLLYSLAQAYRLGGKPEKALAAYSAFLRAASSSPKYRSQVERAASEIESITSFMLTARTAEKPAAPAEPANQDKPAAEVAIAPPPVKAPAGEGAPEAEETKIEPPALLPKPEPAPAPALTFAAEERAAPEPPPASRPVYKRWWFWTGVAVALAAGGAAAWYYTQPTNDTPPSTYGSVRVLP
jgi:tetratricopeptide (TPR) repeat protein